jgi:hypothetical protein
MHKTWVLTKRQLLATKQAIAFWFIIAMLVAIYLYINNHRF